MELKSSVANTFEAVFARESMSGKKLHFGIIGAGRIGRVHAETLAFRLPEAEIVAIADVNREAAEALAARCGIPKVVAIGRGNHWRPKRSMRC